jgi:hypothetical protein
MTRTDDLKALGRDILVLAYQGPRTMTRDRRMAGGDDDYLVPVWHTVDRRGRHPPPAVGVAHAGIVAWTHRYHPDLTKDWLLPVATETWDGSLNDINAVTSLR